MKGVVCAGALALFMAHDAYGGIAAPSYGFSVREPVGYGGNCQRAAAVMPKFVNVLDFQIELKQDSQHALGAVHVSGETLGVSGPHVESHYALAPAPDLIDINKRLPVFENRHTHCKLLIGPDDLGRHALSQLVSSRFPEHPVLAIVLDDTLGRGHKLRRDLDASKRAYSSVSDPEDHPDATGRVYLEARLDKAQVAAGLHLANAPIFSDSEASRLGGLPSFSDGGAGGSQGPANQGEPDEAKPYLHNSEVNDVFGGPRRKDVRLVALWAAIAALCAAGWGYVASVVYSGNNFRKEDARPD